MSTPYDPTPTGGPAAEPPLNQPFYGAPIGAAVRRFFGKYATFSGRASRSEYWWWVLIGVVIGIVLSLLGEIGGGVNGNGSGGPTAIYIIFAIISGLWALAIIVPTLALSWRRCHDSNHSGGFWFLGLIPCVGWIIVLIFMLLAPDPAGTRFDR